jgi:signal peptidase
MRLSSINDERSRVQINKRLRLLATVSLLSLVIPMIVSSVSVRTTFIIASESMIPELMPGDIVTITPTKDQVTNGTIVVFQSPRGGFEAHRITWSTTIGSDIFYKTKGDANNRTDSYLISGESIVGPVTKIIPRVGLVFMIPREIALITTITLIIFYIYLTFKFDAASHIPEKGLESREYNANQSNEKLIQIYGFFIILLMANMFPSSASLNLSYCDSPNTISYIQPKLVFQNGTIGVCRIFDGGTNAYVMVNSSLATYDYVLKITNNNSDSWLVNLKAYESSNIERIQHAIISFHNGSTSSQIIIDNGVITQTEGQMLELSNSTIHIKITELLVNSPGDSFLYIDLTSRLQDSDIYLKYFITVEII